MVAVQVLPLLVIGFAVVLQPLKEPAILTVAAVEFV